MNSRLGIDLNGDSIRAIRPRSSESLVSFDLFTELPLAISADPGDVPAVTLTIPGSESIITTVILPDTLDWQARTLFELSQSMLEPIDTFRIMLEPSPSQNHILAALIRKDIVSALASALGLNGSREHVAIVPRGLALANGFRTFCQRPPGDLLCLVDIAGREATVTITHRGRPVHFGAVAFTDLSTFAVDFRTWINVHLASISQHEITEPLGGVVVTGEPVNDYLMSELTAQFVCPVSPAQWDPDRAPLDSDGRPLDVAWLVALGALAK